MTRKKKPQVREPFTEEERRASNDNLLDMLFDDLPYDGYAEDDAEETVALAAWITENIEKPTRSGGVHPTDVEVSRKALKEFERLLADAILRCGHDALYAARDIAVAEDRAALLKAKKSRKSKKTTAASRKAA
jgi:hypothetical protein